MIAEKLDFWQILHLRKSLQHKLKDKKPTEEVLKVFTKIKKLSLFHKKNLYMKNEKAI